MFGDLAAHYSVGENVQTKRVVFLDRDGVINRNLDNDYVKTWDEFQFLPKAKEAIKILTDANWEIIVISNQETITNRGPAPLFSFSPSIRIPSQNVPSVT